MKQKLSCEGKVYGPKDKPKPVYTKCYYFKKAQELEVENKGLKETVSNMRKVLIRVRDNTEGPHIPLVTACIITNDKGE